MGGNVIEIYCIDWINPDMIWYYIRSCPYNNSILRQWQSKLDHEETKDCIKMYFVSVCASDISSLQDWSG